MDPYKRLDRGHVPLYWELAATSDGIGFEHRDRGIVVEAVRVTDSTHELELPWRLRCVRRCNEACSTREVGQVASQGEAVSALFDWMRRINERIDPDDETPVDVAAIGTDLCGDPHPTADSPRGRSLGR
jgi:hypothetical protein